MIHSKQYYLLKGRYSTHMCCFRVNSPIIKMDIISFVVSPNYVHCRHSRYFMNIILYLYIYIVYPVHLLTFHRRYNCTCTYILYLIGKYAGHDDQMALDHIHIFIMYVRRIHTTHLQPMS